MQNASIESFNGRLRNEMLNETLLLSLSYAFIIIAEWQADTTPIAYMRG